MRASYRPRLLIVEDDPEIQHILSVVLHEDDREIVTAGTAEQARSRLQEGDVDLVLLDLILPDADGRSVLEELRASPRTSTVPVVVLSARAAPEIRSDCYALGADAFVEKPFDAEELAADVTVRLHRAARAERASQVDPLTGLLNRTGLEAACGRLRDGYGVGVVQIDDFAARSEAWDWDEAGDVVRQVGRTLRESVPDHVQIGRLGGGEFVLVAQATDEQGVTLLAERALEALNALRPPEPERAGTPLTATAGVVTAGSEDPLAVSVELARQRIFRARTATEGAPQPVGEGPAHDSGRVVVAEDDEISATILLHRLEKEGLDVLRFDNGQEAYEEVLRERPRLVILDVKMPGLDGFEVLERLRKDHRFSNVPVIMLTSMGQEADVVRAFRMGADDYILKPFSPSELSARVRRLLARGRLASSL